MTSRIILKKLLDNLNIVGVVSQNKDDFSSSVLPIILKSVGKHPRNIKRLLNSFSLLLRIQNSADDESKKKIAGSIVSSDKL